MKRLSYLSAPSPTHPTHDNLYGNTEQKGKLSHYYHQRGTSAHSDVRNAAGVNVPLLLMQEVQLLPQRGLKSVILEPTKRDYGLGTQIQIA